MDRAVSSPDRIWRIRGKRALTEWECDELTATLNEKERELCENLMDAQREVTILTDCETFCFAFKLGAKIMMDVLTDGPMKEI